MNEINLALYDLSRGMAASVSAQFLGPDHTIEIVPHTGILAFGKEYFFGGGGAGISSEDPNQFRTTRAMQPMQIIPLGRSTVTKEQFDTWCHNQVKSGRFHGDAYDLLSKNCNNFSDAAAKEGLKVSIGVPQWILDVPSRFLASPMGQLMRPTLENMQLSGGGGVPFAIPQSSVPPRQQTVGTDFNPWAASTVPVKHTRPPELDTPLLDSNNRPLFSKDFNTAKLCASKLIQASTEDADKAALEKLHIALSQDISKPPADVIDNGCIVICQHLMEVPANLTFSLMLLRLVVLHTPTIWSQKCIAWVQEQLLMNGKSLLSTTASKSMAWCVLSNNFGSHPELDNNLEEICTSAMSCIAKEQPLEVRQSASAFLYNVALIQSPLMSEHNELPDLLVMLLFGALEGLDDELDTITKVRRLLCAARLVKSDIGINIAAKRLILDSEFDAVVKALVINDDDTVAPLATEFLGILES